MPAAPRATLARVFTIQDIEGMFAYSRCHIYRLMRANKFPPCRKSRPGGRRVVWDENVIEAFQNGTWVAPE